MRDANVRPTTSRGTFVALADVGGKRAAFVADEDDEAIVAVDLENERTLGRAPLRATPGQIVLGADGTLYAAVRGASEVVALRLRQDGTFREVARHATGDEPYGLTLAPGRLLVSTLRDARLETYAAADLAPGAVVDLPRDPRSIALAPDGTRAFVSHASGSSLSVVELATLRARRVTLDANELRRDFGMKVAMKPRPPMPDGSFRKLEPPTILARMVRSATQGFGLATIGDEVLVPDVLVFTGNNEIVSSGYGSFERVTTLGSNVPFVSRVGIDDEKLRNADFSGPADRECFEEKKECLLPRAVSDDGRLLFVACFDTNAVLVVDPKADAEHAKGCKKTIEARPRVEVERPSGVAVDAEREEVVVFSSVTRTLSIGRTSGGKPRAAIELPRLGAPPATTVALGRKLFHETQDRRISGDGRACASCHVDGREDGLVWPTPKGRMQTPMLAGRLLQTAPYGWNGEHESLSVHIKSTIGNLGGTGLPAQELQALADFVGSMKVPARRTGAANDVVARGKEIFHSSEAECSTCHVDNTRFTDGVTHRFGSSQAAFDTPSLAFVGATAPYFHDGRFATLDELVDKCDGVMGSTKQLSVADRKALVAYLRTL